ncbi:MAG: hypothetical protein V9E99_15860 [Microthrixaceae bacterium]
MGLFPEECELLGDGWCAGEVDDAGDAFGLGEHDGPEGVAEELACFVDGDVGVSDEFADFAGFGVAAGECGEVDAE